METQGLSEVGSRRIVTGNHLINTESSAVVMEVSGEEDGVVHPVCKFFMVTNGQEWKTCGSDIRHASMGWVKAPPHQGVFLE